jgi:hypothetical protein
MPIAITVNRCIILRIPNVLSLLRAFVCVLAFVGYASRGAHGWGLSGAYTLSG